MTIRISGPVRLRGGRWFYASPSAIEAWNLCPARAVAKYVGGFREPTTPAMEEGTRLHRVTQHALVTGHMPSMTERAVHKIIGALPIPIGTVEPRNIERVLLLPALNGFIDWSDDFGRQGDLKFTSSVKYQKAKDPRKDAQRILYALDYFYREPFAADLKQTWSVSQFNGAKALRLDHTWTRRSAKKKFALHVHKPLDMLQEAVHNQLDWQRAPKNFESCHAYNKPCHMIAKGCKRSLSQRLASQKPGTIKVDP